MQEANYHTVMTCEAKISLNCGNQRRLEAIKNWYTSSTLSLFWSVNRKREMYCSSIQQQYCLQCLHNVRVFSCGNVGNVYLNIHDVTIDTPWVFKKTFPIFPQLFPHHFPQLKQHQIFMTHYNNSSITKRHQIFIAHYNNDSIVSKVLQEKKSHNPNHMKYSWRAQFGFTY